MIAFFESGSHLMAIAKTRTEELKEYIEQSKGGLALSMAMETLKLNEKILRTGNLQARHSDSSLRFMSHEIKNISIFAKNKINKGEMYA